MKILQLTDMHFETYPFESEDKQTAQLIERLTTEHQPDLIAVTGDLISAYKTLNGLAVFQGVVDFLDQLGPKVAITFGNHDAETGYITKLNEEATANSRSAAEKMAYITENYSTYIKVIENFEQIHHYSRRDLIEVVSQMKNHVMKQGLASVSDKEMYYVDANADTRLLFVDSGDYDDFGIGLYDSIDFDQQSWMIRQAAKTDGSSHLFIHIPLPEYADAVSGGFAQGHQAETVCSPQYNTGTWARLKLNSNVKSIYCGHDHENDFSADYFGIQLNYGRSTGYNSDGQVGKGARIIEISGSHWQTYIVE